MQLVGKKLSDEFVHFSGVVNLHVTIIVSGGKCKQNVNKMLTNVNKCKQNNNHQSYIILDLIFFGSISFEFE